MRKASLRDVLDALVFVLLVVGGEYVFISNSILAWGMDKLVSVAMACVSIAYAIAMAWLWTNEGEGRGDA